MPLVFYLATDPSKLCGETTYTHIQVLLSKLLQYIDLYCYDINIPQREFVFVRAINSATAASVIGLDHRAFSNMIGRIGPSELPEGRQGLARRIPVSLLPRLLLTAELMQQFGIPSGEAYRVAQTIEQGTPTTGQFVSIRANLEAIRMHIDTQLEHAIESVVPRPRGRPPRR